MTAPTKSAPLNQCGALTIADAAAYCGGVGQTLFLAQICAGYLPAPRLIGENRQVWLRFELDAALASLPRYCGHGVGFITAKPTNHPEPILVMASEQSADNEWDSYYDEQDEKETGASKICARHN
jgi:hypothetical protein